MKQFLSTSQEKKIKQDKYLALCKLERQILYYQTNYQMFWTPGMSNNSISKEIN